MDSFRLHFPIQKQEKQLSFDRPVVFLGSCFSDEIGEKARLGGLNVISNPFGTLFHPLALAEVIEDSITDSLHFRPSQRDDVWMDWSAAAKLQSTTEEEIKETILGQRKLLKNKLLSASHLFVTFGTAFGYYLKSDGKLVANCHKQASSLFEKRLTPIEEMSEVWIELSAKLQGLNPNLNIVFTVSPVRHIKDGLVENNRSKARLHLLVEQLQSAGYLYFPSYEIVNDELRDYRFFTNDNVHPNDLAIDYVWKRFLETFVQEDVITWINRVQKFHLALNHRPTGKSELEKVQFAKFLERERAILEEKGVILNTL